MNKKVAAVFLILCGLSVIVFALSSKYRQKPELVIGAVLPLSGPGAVFAEYIKDGITLAEKDLAESGTNVGVIYQDSKSNPRDGVEAFRSLVSTSKVNSAIVALSSVANAVSPIVKNSKLIVIYTAVAIPGIADGRHSFRLYPDANGMAGVMAKYLHSKGSRKAVVFYVNDDFGLASLRAFKSFFEVDGGKVLVSRPFEARGASTRDDVSFIQQAGKDIDVIFIAGYGPNYGSIIRQLREAGVTSQIAGDMTLGLPTTIKQIGEASQNLIFVDGIMSEAFRQRFKKSFPTKVPTSYAGFAYDAVNVLSISNQQSSNNVITRESMAKTLRRTQGFNGAMGQFYFNNEGESGINFGVYTIVNGNARLIRTTP
jgi:branched-chain amino acid transport system substrate-binding protein